MRKKALILATRKFWPTNSGKDVTLFYNCKGLSEYKKYDVYVVCFTNDEIKKEEIPSFIKAVKVMPSINLYKRVYNVLRYSTMNNWPIQQALYTDKKCEKFFEAYIQEIRPDVVFVDMVRLHSYCKYIKNIKKIMIMEDLLSERYERQLRSDYSSLNIGGYYSSNIPSLLNNIVNSTLLKKIILEKEAARIKRLENECVEYYDFITLVSSLEKDKYNKRNGTSKAIHLGMGVEYEYYAENIHNLNEYDDNISRIVFVGNLSYAPNVASIEYIVRKILPYITAKFVFMVIGYCPESIKDNYNSENIIFLGRVDDFRPIVKGADLFLAPIAFGTGIKTKIVEAMAMGMPVFTNSIGAEGIEVENGKEMFIIDDAVSMINKINHELKDKDKLKDMGNRAQRYAYENHRWEVIYRNFSLMNL